ANFHPRVNIHAPGPGVGGHCIAVDPWFIVELQPELSKIIKLSRTTNNSMPEYVAEQAQKLMMEYTTGGKKAAVFGLSFKGNVDDMRESPAVTLIEELQKRKIEVASYDPHIKPGGHPTQKDSVEEALEDAEILLIVTDHNEFKNLDPNVVAQQMKSKIVYDTKNILDRSIWKAAGFNHHLLGDSKEK
ncbi:MAG TPA: UDP binding domain-containing protein, partial [Sporosarcina sp.]|nr:UDP binding domain-containing protein [Sporosarcina sp.]